MRQSMIFLLGVFLLFNYKLTGQENEGKEKKYGIKFSGFVKNDFFFDTRQTVSAREGHFLLWPSSENLDANGEDLNDKPNFNFLAVQSRLKGAITGPDAFGAKTSGVIEGDFFAQANDNINLFRLRHAFIKLNWENTELLTGQTWNPLFVVGCYPGTVSFNTGTPLQSFARNPQIRLTQQFGGLSLVLAALGQRDYASVGPDGTSSAYLRNAMIPDMHFQIHYNVKNEDSGMDILTGLGIAYKSIVPRLSSTPDSLTYKVDESVSGLTAIGFATIKLLPVTIKLQGRYGENITDVLSISGFAVKGIENQVTGEQSYTPLKSITFWGDFHTNGKAFQAGVFGGYLKNLGTKEAMSDISNTVYGLGTNIETLLRISPRVVFISNKFKIAAELEYTMAAYGSSYDEYYIPSSTSQVSNIRLLLSTIYSF